MGTLLLPRFSRACLSFSVQRTIGTPDQKRDTNAVLSQVICGALLDSQHRHHKPSSKESPAAYARHAMQVLLEQFCAAVLGNPSALQAWPYTNLVRRSLSPAP